VNWESLTRGITILIATALVVFLGYSVYRTYYDIPRDFSQTDINSPVTLDADDNLKSTLDTLETVWENRQNFRFALRQDPLFLGRVIKDFTYETESGESKEESAIRLSATVVDDNPKAIIKYRGKSYVVQAGDYIDNTYRVVKIEERQVVLDNNGKRMVLTSKPVSGFDEKEMGSEYSNNTNLRNYN
jgi:type II secretory pathway component PulC